MKVWHAVVGGVAGLGVLGFGWWRWKQAQDDASAPAPLVEGPGGQVGRLGPLGGPPSPASSGFVTSQLQRAPMLSLQPLPAGRAPVSKAARAATAMAVAKNVTSATNVALSAARASGALAQSLANGTATGSAAIAVSQASVSQAVKMSQAADQLAGTAIRRISGL